MVMVDMVSFSDSNSLAAMEKTLSKNIISIIIRKIGKLIATALRCALHFFLSCSVHFQVISFIIAKYVLF